MRVSIVVYGTPVCVAMWPILYFLAERLTNFDVFVTSDVINPNQSSDKRTCAHYPGTVGAGQWIEFMCEPFHFGR